MQLGGKRAEEVARIRGVGMDGGGDGGGDGGASIGGREGDAAIDGGGRRGQSEDYEGEDGVEVAWRLSAPIMESMTCATMSDGSFNQH